MRLHTLKMKRKVKEWEGQCWSRLESLINVVTDFFVISSEFLFFNKSGKSLPSWLFLEFGNGGREKKGGYTKTCLPMIGQVKHVPANWDKF